VAFSVPEAQLPAIRRRMARGKLLVRAIVPVEQRPEAQGSLSFLDNTVDVSTGTIRLKGSFPNSDRLLWPGQFVDVSLRLEERSNAVVVPSAAVQSGQMGNFVYVLKGDSTVELRPITAGARFQEMTAVDKGLNGDEQVVIEGQLRLAPGLKVRVIS
jgi:multidrug efflux system membrane fusion protein